MAFQYQVSFVGDEVLTFLQAIAAMNAGQTIEREDGDYITWQFRLRARMFESRYRTPWTPTWTSWTR